MFNIKINLYTFLIRNDLSILEACNYLGIVIPRFCYHEGLSIVGNCRVCLVEINTLLKVVPSCATPLVNFMEIFINTPRVKKARENVLEILLLNHPLDCPICDQGGECDLQDQVKEYGIAHSRVTTFKRGVENKIFDNVVKTIMTRCIHCTRCVRFGIELVGVSFLGTFNRGKYTEIGNYTNKINFSEISGNVVDLCPVGALTLKSNAFQSRPWELKCVESIDLTDGLGSNIYVTFKGTEILQIYPKINKTLNSSWISNKARFYFDSIKYSRLKSVYHARYHSNGIKLDSGFGSWNPKIDKSSVLFLVNEEMDLKALNILKNISQIYPVTIKLRSVIKSSKSSNYYLNWLNNKVVIFNDKVKTFVLLSTNIRIENAIINMKIRTKYLHKHISVINLGNKFSSTFSLLFVNLTLNILLSIFEAKNVHFSKKIFCQKNPIFIIGESFLQRFLNKMTLIQHILKFNPSSYFLTVNLKNNTESNSYLNIKSLTKNDFINNPFLVCFNLKMTTSISKILNNLAKFSKILWFHSFMSDFNLGSKKNYNNITFLPLASYFEDLGIYINMEHRAQGQLRESSSLKENSIITWLFWFIKQNNLIINAKSRFTQKDHLNFFLEMSKKPKFFNQFQPTFINYNLFVNKFSSGYFLKYPFKSVFEDFYLNNSSTSNSRLMHKLSWNLQKKYNNFK